MKPWLRWISPILLAFLLATSAAHAAEVEDTTEESRTVAVGGIDTIDFPFAPKPPTIGNATLVRIDPGSNSNQVRVVPIKKGTTTIQFDGPDGKVFKKINYNFPPGPLADKVAVIRKLLQDVEGITVEALDEKIVIDGELIVPKDFDRILQVQEAYKDQVFNLVSLSKISREAIARKMQKEINDDPGGVNVQVAIKNDTFFLTGKVDNAGDKERADWIAQTFMPEYQGSLAINNQVLKDTVKRFSIRNLIVVEEAPAPPPKKMVRVTYHFVEIGKDFLKQSMFKWVPFLQ
jgi:Flp pilus assembly secretin CpaC